MLLHFTLTSPFPVLAFRRLTFLYPLGEIIDQSLLHECLLAPPTTGHHLIVHTWE